jgi:putative mycofactocin binding protein MftB
MSPEKTAEGGSERFKLAPGAQVRKENFGLLFYQRQGPRLYFLNCGSILDEDYFSGELSLEKWIGRNTGRERVSLSKLLSLKSTLNDLKKKGVIIEC